jgi:hypothetical protein
MWNNPKSAPEYQIGWKDKVAASQSLTKILSWNFDSIILSHGDLIDKNAKNIAKKSWQQLIKY